MDRRDIHQPARQGVNALLQQFGRQAQDQRPVDLGQIGHAVHLRHSGEQLHAATDILGEDRRVMRFGLGVDMGGNRAADPVETRIKRRLFGLQSLQTGNARPQRYRIAVERPAMQ